MNNTFDNNFKKGCFAALGIDVPEIVDISAGGMPDRVKCLHSLIAHQTPSE